MTESGGRKAGVLGLSGAEWATIAIALAAATLPAVLPLMVGVLARQFAIGTEQAGYVVAMNMGAILAGSLSCILLARRLDFRALIWGGLAVMVTGNILTMLTDSLNPMLATRVISGWGEGVVAACCYALMGRARLPGRSIAFYTGGQAIVGAVGLAILPSLMAAYGWHVFYVLVSLVAVPAALLAPYAARRSVASKSAGSPAVMRGRPSAAGLGVLGSIFMFFAGLAMIWTFMERLGADQRLSVVELSAALSSSALAGLLGSFAAGAIADRIERKLGMALGMLTIGISLGSLLTPGFWPYATAICGLTFAWAYQFPFLFRCLAETDRDGGVALLTPVATGGALTVGPAIGGYLLANGGPEVLSCVCLGLTAVATILSAALGRTRAQQVEGVTPLSTARIIP